MGGEQDEASDWAVAEVGMARGRSVTLSPSMLLLLTRDSSSSERSSADSLSTWIILRNSHSWISVQRERFLSACKDLIATRKACRQPISFFLK